MVKKGQITVFVILGLVVLILFVFFLTSINREEKVDFDNTQINHHLSQCAEESLKFGLENFELNSERIVFYEEASKNISFISYNGVDYFPDDASIRNKLQDLILDSFSLCLEIVQESLSIDVKDISGFVDVLESRIIFESSVSLDMIESDLMIYEEKVSANVITSFYNDIILLREFSEIQTAEPDMFNIGKLSEISFVTGADYYLFFKEGYFFVNFLFFDDNINLERGVWFAVG